MASQYVARTYKILTSKGIPVIINRARGSKIYDIYGKSYLDATASYSAANFGHGNEHFKQVLKTQIDNISLCPRFLENDNLNKLGLTIDTYFRNKINVSNDKKLQIILGSDGTTSVDAAIKIARAWGPPNKGIEVGKTKQIFANGNFHGRSFGALSVSDYPYQKKFYPKVPGLSVVPYNDVASLEHEFLDECVTAVIIEPIQGEGGIILPSLNYLSSVRKLCDKHNVLMICDEIQTGIFRTGTLLCSEQYNAKPDIAIIGKSLGGGYLPISLCIGSEDVMSVIKQGEHGNTFGGNPLASAMATSVLKYVHNYNTFETVSRLSRMFSSNLTLLSAKYPFIKDVRGKGLFFGIEFDEKFSSDEIANDLVDYGILTKGTAKNTLRITPPFVITDGEIEELFDGLNKYFKKI